MIDQQPNEEPGGGGESLLVVDDDPFIARLLEIELKAAGYDVRVASDGVQALESAQERSPDLVLADVMMPNMDGFELTRRLRQDPRTAGVSIIMLTARGLSADKLEGFAIGADDYIVKPFDTPELLARIRGVLRRSRDMRAQSPLTGLPGNVRIEEEIDARVEQQIPFAILYADLDNFKSFNDHYGFMRGDQAIQATARMIEDVARELSGGAAFVGHVGGDDFVVVVSPEKAATVAQVDRRPLRQDGGRALRRGGSRARVHRGRQPPRRAAALPGPHHLDRRRHHRPARVPALRRGRRRGHGDEAVHEGRHRLLLGDRPSHLVVRHRSGFNPDRFYPEPTAV